MATIDLGKIKFNWRNAYNGSTPYVPDDCVYYTDGSVVSSYICKTASTGNAPSSGGTLHGSWDYLAKGQNASPTTTQGDIIVRGASADARLAIGAAGKALKVNATANGLEYGDAGAWTKIAGGSGPDATSFSIDNIFSADYNFYKLYYSWAEDDWMRFRYIKADGSIESGNVYVHSGRYSKENPAGDGRIGHTNQNYGYYHYWNSADDNPAMCEVTYVDPYASGTETNDFFQAMSVQVNNMFQHVGANSNMNAYSVRGVQLYGSGGDSLTSTNFKYLVLGAKI